MLKSMVIGSTSIFTVSPKYCMLNFFKPIIFHIVFKLAFFWIKNSSLLNAHMLASLRLRHSRELVG